MTEKTEDVEADLEKLVRGAQGKYAEDENGPEHYACVVRSEIRTLRERLEEVEEERDEAVQAVESIALSASNDPQKLRRRAEMAVAEIYDTPNPEVWAETRKTMLRDQLLAARRRTDRLEGALERLGSMEAFEMSRAVSDHPADKELLARVEYARSALDSREDEGENCTCAPPRVNTGGSLGGTLPDVDDRKDPDCPVHGEDEGERDALR